VRVHWDCIAEAFRAESAPTSHALNRFWQSLPPFIEDGAWEARETALRQPAVDHQESTMLRERLDDTVRLLTRARAEMAARDARISDLMESISWRCTAPLRFAARQIPRFRKRPIMKLDSIRHQRLETDPYGWACIHHLFNDQDVARLAATYPCDHFKLVST